MLRSSGSKESLLPHHSGNTDDSRKSVKLITCKSIFKHARPMLPFLILLLMIATVFWEVHYTSKMNLHNARKNPVNVTLDSPPLHHPTAAEDEKHQQQQHHTFPLPLQSIRYLRIGGFTYCRILENAILDAFSHIYPLNGPIAERNVTATEVVNLIDSEAQKAHNKLMTAYPVLDAHATHRFACYSAVEGANHLTKLAKTRLLHSLDAKEYFKDILPTLGGKVDSTAVTPGSKHRRKYGLAYLVMIHGHVFPTLDNLKAMIEELDDGTAIFLVHVDPQYAELLTGVQEWINSRNQIIKEQQRNQKQRRNEQANIHIEKHENNLKDESSQSHQSQSGDRLASDSAKTEDITPKSDDYEVGNVFLAKNHYRGMWGHISLVWMQLSGFWELQDLADWDYIINLSVADYPLRKSREIYRLLQKEGSRGMNYIGYWPEPIRTFRPHIARTDRPSAEYSTLDVSRVSGLRSLPNPTWNWCKHHQWMMLTRDFVTYLREDQEALDTLAFVEHMWIPDEAYFCIVATNSQKFHTKIISDSKRFVEFGRGKMHPHVLNINWTHKFPEQDEVGAEPPYYFVRKVYQFTEEERQTGVPSPGRELVKWIQVKHLKKHLLPPSEYEKVMKL